MIVPRELACHRGSVFRMTIRLLILAVLATGTSSFAQTPPRQPGNETADSQATTPEQDVQAAMKDAIARLKAGDVVGFIEFYAPVDELRQARRGRLGKSYERIRNPTAAANVINRLERTSGTTPQINIGGFLATFTIPPPIEKSTDSPTSEPAPKISKEPLSGYPGSLAEALQAAVVDIQADRTEAMVDRLFPRGELGHPEAALRCKQLTARLKQHPEMAKQMLSDLQAILKTQDVQRASGDAAAIAMKGQLVSTGRGRQMRLPDRTFRFEKVEGFWRFQDSTSKLVETQAKIAEKAPPPLSEFGASDVVIMERFGDRWRFLEF
jgi:hypothetical protein